MRAFMRVYMFCHVGIGRFEDRSTDRTSRCLLYLHTAVDFPDQWKAWIKAVGKATKKKGKGLFHPIRLALTGRMSGPDVGEQVHTHTFCILAPFIPCSALD